MVTAGATAGITQGLEIGKLSAGMNMAERAKTITQQSMVNIGVRGAMAGATGEKLTGIMRSEALSGGLALGQSKIGDIGVDKGLKTGSFAKTAMHATTGAIYSAATGASALSGAIGGAVSEVVAGIMESGSGITSPPSNAPLTAEQAKINADNRITLGAKIKATTKLTSAAASLVAGGKAKDINTAVTVGESALTHNRRLHPSEEQVLAELQAGKTPEEQRRLELAAKSMVRASAGLSTKDDQLAPLTADELEGSQYVKEQNMLVTHAEKRGLKLKPLQDMEYFGLAEGHGGNPSKYTQRTFDYSILDGVGDGFSSREEGVYRFEQAEDSVFGIIGSNVLKKASGIVGTIPFGYGDSAARKLDSGASHLLNASIMSASSSIAPGYKATEGATVQASFKQPISGTYSSEHAGTLVSIATLPVAGSGKVVGKVMPKVFRGGKTNIEILQLTTSQLKAIRSYKKRIKEHEVKLLKFKNNLSIRPGMENLPKTVIKAQQKVRVKHLETEIQTFKNNLEKIKNSKRK